MPEKKITAATIVAAKYFSPFSEIFQISVPIKIAANTHTTKTAMLKIVTPFNVFILGLSAEISVSSPR